MADLLRETAWDSKRNREEAGTLAAIIDALLGGDPALLLEVAVRRFIGLQLVAQTGNWTMMDVISVPGLNGTNTLPIEDITRLMNQARHMDRARDGGRPASASAGHFGSSSSTAARPSTGSGPARRRGARGGQRARPSHFNQSAGPDRDGGHAHPSQRTASRASSARSSGTASGAGGAPRT